MGNSLQNSINKILKNCDWLEQSGANIIDKVTGFEVAVIDENEEINISFEDWNDGFLCGMVPFKFENYEEYFLTEDEVDKFIETINKFNCTRIMVKKILKNCDWLELDYTEIVDKVNGGTVAEIVENDGLNVNFENWNDGKLCGIQPFQFDSGKKYYLSVDEVDEFIQVITNFNEDKKNIMKEILKKCDWLNRCGTYIKDTEGRVVAEFVDNNLDVNFEGWNDGFLSGIEPFQFSGYERYYLSVDEVDEFIKVINDFNAEKKQKLVDKHESLEKVLNSCKWLKKNKAQGIIMDTVSKCCVADLDSANINFTEWHNNELKGTKPFIFPEFIELHLTKNNVDEFISVINEFHNTRLIKMEFNKQAEKLLKKFDWLYIDNNGDLVNKVTEQKFSNNRNINLLDWHGGKLTGHSVLKFDGNNVIYLNQNNFNAFLKELREYEKNQLLIDKLLKKFPILKYSNGKVFVKNNEKKLIVNNLNTNFIDWHQGKADKVGGFRFDGEGNIYLRRNNVDKFITIIQSYIDKYGDL